MDAELRDRTLAQLRELAVASEGDPESAHSQADELLCNLLSWLGYEDVAEAFRNIQKWYA